MEYLFIKGAAALLLLAGGKYYLNGGTCKAVRDISYEVIVITGASSGIGEATVRLLAEMKPTIVLACRNREKTMPIIQQI